MNIPTINDVQFLSDGELQDLPLDVLGVLHGEATATASLIAALKKRVVQAVEAKYADELSNLTTGSVKIVRGGVEVTVTKPKKVEWDGVSLGAYASNPDFPIETKYSVSEKAYSEATGIVRHALEQARTVSPGSISLKFRDLENRGSE
jgi:hypothetical protein